MERSALLLSLATAVNRLITSKPSKTGTFAHICGRILPGWQKNTKLLLLLRPGDPIFPKAPFRLSLLENQ
jgi:hypothetical protein